MTTRALPSVLHRVRRTGLAALAASTLLLSGCALMSPISTSAPMLTADGVDADLSPTLLVRDLVVVADKANGPGRISGQIVNDESSSVEVKFSAADGGATTVDVPASTSMNLAKEPINLDKVPVPPGSVLNMTVSTAKTGENILQVPVVPADLFFSELTPAPAASS